MPKESAGYREPAEDHAVAVALADRSSRIAWLRWMLLMPGSIVAFGVAARGHILE